MAYDADQLLGEQRAIFGRGPSRVMLDASFLARRFQTRQAFEHLGQPRFYLGLLRVEHGIALFQCFDASDRGCVLIAGGGTLSIELCQLRAQLRWRHALVVARRYGIDRWNGLGFGFGPDDGIGGEGEEQGDARKTAGHLGRFRQDEVAKRNAFLSYWDRIPFAGHIAPPRWV